MDETSLGPPWSPISTFRIVAAVLLVTIPAVPSCDRAPTSGVHAPWESARSTQGDTTLVRTLSGSVWGDTMVLAPELAIGELDGAAPLVFGEISGLDVDAEGRIWVVDAQAAEVRVFSPTGDHLFTAGGQGEGPGEFSRPDVIRIRSDGAAVVRDWSNGRFSILTAEGEYGGDWRIPSNFATSTPFFLDADGGYLNPGAGDLFERQGLVRFDEDGVVLDTVAYPEPPIEREYLEAERESARIRYAAPFTPFQHWTVDADGGFITGTSTAYRVDWRRADGTVLRVEREVLPVPVMPAEAEATRRTITEQMRRVVPDWEWDGAPIPEVKPPFQGLFPGRDRTLWVLRSARAMEVDNPSWDPERPERGDRSSWVPPTILDVYDDEGRYLGPVRFPPANIVRPSSLTGGVLTGEHVWVAAIHELGYPQVVRYRLHPKAAATP